MQKIITKKCFLLFVALFSMVLQAQVTENQPAITPEMALALHTEALKQIEPLKIALQHVAHLAQTGNLKTVNPQMLSDWAYNTMRIINTHHTTSQNKSAELKTIGETLLFNRALINHVLSAFKHNFSHLIPFSSETIIQRNGLIEVTPELIEKLINDNNNSLSELDKNAKKFGISYVNKFFRGIDRAINIPIIKYPLGIIAAGLGVYLAGKAVYSGLGKLDQLHGFITDDGKYRFHNQGIPMSYQHAVFGNSGLFRGEIFPRILPDVVGKTTTELVHSQLLNFISKVSSPFVAAYFAASKISAQTWSKLKGEEKDADFKIRGDIIEDITLDHPSLIGLEEQKQQLMDNIVAPLLNPELFMHNGMELERAIALIGPSRNGKTLIARALCGTINAAFKASGKFDRIGFQEIPHWALFHPEYGLKNLILQAQAEGPMVLFIDEYHLIHAQTTGNSYGLYKQLTELETLYQTNDPHKTVFLIIATNRPDSMDPALFQHKRFGITIRFAKPDHRQRKAFFESKAQQLAITLDDKSILSFVGQTYNCSYGDLDQIFQEAKVLAKQHAQSLEAGHIQAAINRFVHRIKKNIALDDNERTIAAAHFAGRALVHNFLHIDEQIELITILGIERSIKEKNDFMQVNDQGIRKNPNNDKIYKPRYGKMVTYNSHEAMNVRTADEMLKLAQRRLAGIIAEEVLLGTRSMTYHPNDRQKALDIIKSVLLQGLKEEQLPEKQREEIITQALERIIKLETDVRMLLQTNKTILEKIYQALLEKETLMGPDFRALIS